MVSSQRKKGIFGYFEDLILVIFENYYLQFIDLTVNIVLLKCKKSLLHPVTAWEIEKGGMVHVITLQICHTDFEDVCVFSGVYNSA